MRRSDCKFQLRISLAGETYMRSTLSVLTHIPVPWPSPLRPCQCLGQSWNLPSSDEEQDKVPEMCASGGALNQCQLGVGGHRAQPPWPLCGTTLGKWDWVPAAHRGDTLTSDWLPSLTSPSPPTILLGITSHITYLSPDSCLRVCFGGLPV